MESKMPLARQVRVLRRSRDKWKERSNEKQEHIKYLEIKVRDLKKSRDMWKARTKGFEGKLQEMDERPGKEKKSPVTDRADKPEAEMSLIGKDTPVFEVACGHHYPLHVVGLGVRSFIENGLSLRGVSATFRLFSEYFNIGVPSYSSIRNWVFRVGLFLLQHSIVEHPCETWILDHTIETGNQKLFLAVGISPSALGACGFTPKFSDADLLELQPVVQSNGELVYEYLENMSKRFGPPAQIVIDGGGDLQKGADLFIDVHRDVVKTYDISHKLALELQHELDGDDGWTEFKEAIAETGNLVRQTDLLFTIPPALRVKAKYMNAQLLINWAYKVLRYSEKNDFSLVSEVYQLSPSTLVHYCEELSDEQLFRAGQMVGVDYVGKESFISDLSRAAGKTVINKNLDDLLARSSRGKRDFMMKLGWVQEFERELEEYARFITVVEYGKKEVRTKGLSRETADNVEGFIRTLPRLTDRTACFEKRIIEAIHEEGSRIPNFMVLLGMSEIIESIFGKYKNFSSRRPIKTIGEIILTIPIFLTKLTPNLLKKALETTSLSDFQDWSDETFGRSALSKRIAAFS